MGRIASIVVSFGAAAMGTPLVAQSPEFAANHLFVSDFSTHVYELDESGAIVRVIDVSAYLPFASGLAFGPDGRIWVGSQSDDVIVGLDGNGQLVGVIGHPSALAVEAVEFDTLGQPLLTSGAYADVVRVSLDGSSSTLIFDGNQPLVDLEIDRRGFVLVSDTNDGIVRFIARDGSSSLTNGVSLSAFTPDVNARGFAVERKDRVSVADFDTPRVLFGTDWIGSAAVEKSIPTASNEVEDIDYGPDGRLYLATRTGKQILAFERSDGSVTTFASLPGTAYLAGYLAFAPFRFDVRVTGRVTTDDGEIEAIDESAVLSIQPASRLVALIFTDGAITTDFATLTGLDRFVTYGEPSDGEAPGNRRSIHARAPRSEFAREDVTLVCDWKRTIDAHGFERVASAKGSLWFADASTQVHIEFKTTNLRNP